MGNDETEQQMTQKSADWAALAVRGSCGNRSSPSQAVNPQRRTASDLTEITSDFYCSKA